MNPIRPSLSTSLSTLAVSTSLAAAPALAAGPSATAAQVSEWRIDPAHVTAQFSVRHMMVSTVRGQFAKVTGSVRLDEQDPTRSQIEIRIDARSIDTRNDKRDEHLRSADFFDVEQHPELVFRSTRIARDGKSAGKFKVTGELTMRGVTRPVTLSVEGPTAVMTNPWGVRVRGVSATGKLNRKDWGLNWNAALEAGGFLVGDTIEIAFDAELNPAPVEQASAAAR